MAGCFRIIWTVGNIGDADRKVASNIHVPLELVHRVLLKWGCVGGLINRSIQMQSRIAFDVWDICLWAGERYLSCNHISIRNNLDTSWSNKFEVFEKGFYGVLHSYFTVASCAAWGMENSLWIVQISQDSLQYILRLLNYRYEETFG